MPFYIRCNGYIHQPDIDDGYGACGGGFACIDPDAACVNDDDFTIDMIEDCDSVAVGDGYCNIDNNKEACGACSWRLGSHVPYVVLQKDIKGTSAVLYCHPD